MKPGFALTLSEDGIGLLHRARGGWQRLGDVSLDDPGLGETLRLMRGTAEGLAAGKLLTKLVIPDSQLLYTTLPITGDSPAEKRASLRRGLDGLTPYALDEIVFDWQEVGDGTARIAAVARETLDEAEAFAVQHAFNPVCCVAAPPADKFKGEAFFGPTAAARDLLGKGEKPEPDGRPVRPGGMADYATGDDAPEPARPAAKARPKPVPPAARAKPAAPPSPPDVPAAQTAAPPRTPEPGPAPAPPRRDEAAQANAPPEVPALPFASRRRGEDEPAVPGGGDVPPAPPAPSRLTLTPPGADPAPTAPHTPPKVTADTPTSTTPPPTPARRAPIVAPPRPAAAAPRQPAFPIDTALAARPAAPGRAGLRLVLALTGTLVLAMAGVSLWSLLPDGPEGAEAPQASAPVTAPAPVARISDTPPAGGRELAVLPDEPVTAPPALTPPAMPSVAEDAPTRDAALPDAGAEPAPAAPTPALDETAAAEAYASTGVWQLAPEPMTAPPQDRIEDLYVAALDPSIRPPQAVRLPDPRDSRANDQALPLQPDPPGPDQTFVVDARGLVEATPEGALTPEGVLVFAGPPPVMPRGRTPEPAVDPEAPDARTAAAAPVETTAAPPAAVPLEPAPVPEGVIVIEGRPDLTPPPRPELVVPVTIGPPPVTPPARPAETAPAPEPAAIAPDTAAPAPEAEAEPPPAPDTDARARTGSVPPPGEDIRPAPDAPPETAGNDAGPAMPALPDTAVIATDAATATRLAPYRPRLRPEALVPAALAPAPVPAPDPGLRPRPRPDIPETATAPDLPDPDPTLGADIEAALEAALAEDTEAEADAAESELAIGSSIRPAARPSDLADRVASAAPAVPPSAAAPAPRLPTSANVARQATVENAINLREVNLIGVYGASGDRRALVRLPSGRYEKVKVGDRIDGGRVAAIGESQLRYVKNGRNVVLDLPGG
ncbi:hypothetical protein [Rhodovulum marinum]|uniref:Type IV pilus biogenesis protein PilP n=1 Tax=Rhodovulum marinum TaxID=320662 RepID=A0A4V2SRL1_9RHOB|nr:hypothetical protein [Rhodovulum marinum]TCP43286.1 hypothetical protein EV662_102484 [Rhodovulum marinum]